MERGRQARSNRAGAGGGKRARQVLLREGRGQEPHEVTANFKVGDFDWPWPSRPCARRGASDVLKMRPDEHHGHVASF